jgi:hypothetical protein
MIVEILVEGVDGFGEALVPGEDLGALERSSGVTRLEGEGPLVAQDRLAELVPPRQQKTRLDQCSHVVGVLLEPGVVQLQGSIVLARREGRVSRVRGPNRYEARQQDQD